MSLILFFRIEIGLVLQIRVFCLVLILLTWKTNINIFLKNISALTCGSKIWCELKLRIKIWCELKRNTKQTNYLCSTPSRLTTNLPQWLRSYLHFYRLNRISFDKSSLFTFSFIQKHLLFSFLLHHPKIIKKSNLYTFLVVLW